MNPEEIKKIQVKENLKSLFESTLDQRVNRYLEIDRQGIIGEHHFAEASSQCIQLYIDGYYLSAVMVSQAVNEGIIKFIAQRNKIKIHKKINKKFPRYLSNMFKIKTTKSVINLINEFKNNSIISGSFVDASTRIYKSFRNDIHHMNPKVSKINFPKLAKNNMQDLATIEKEIFGIKYGSSGGIIPLQPKYWDFNKDGTIPVYLRLE